jgi:hypothetical protein
MCRARRFAHILRVERRREVVRHLDDVAQLGRRVGEARAGVAQEDEEQHVDEHHRRRRQDHGERPAGPVPHGSNAGAAREKMPTSALIAMSLVSEARVGRTAARGSPDQRAEREATTDHRLHDGPRPADSRWVATATPGRRAARSERRRGTSVPRSAADTARPRAGDGTDGGEGVPPPRAPDRPAQKARRQHDQAEHARRRSGPDLAAFRRLAEGRRRAARFPRSAYPGGMPRPHTAVLRRIRNAPDPMRYGPAKDRPSNVAPASRADSHAARKRKGMQQ